LAGCVKEPITNQNDAGNNLLKTKFELKDLIFQKDLLPNGYMIDNGWEGCCKMPYIKSNPQISSEREIIKSFAKDVFKDLIDPTSIQACLFVYYYKEEAQEIVIFAFQFANQKARSTACDALKKNDVSTSNGRVVEPHENFLCVISRGNLVTDEDWSNMTKIFLSAITNLSRPAEY
jgi:hypothetical protein